MSPVSYNFGREFCRRIIAAQFPSHDQSVTGSGCLGFNRCAFFQRSLIALVKPVTQNSVSMALPVPAHLPNDLFQLLHVFPAMVCQNNCIPCSDNNFARLLHLWAFVKPVAATIGFVGDTNRVPKSAFANKRHIFRCRLGKSKPDIHEQ